MSSPTAWLSPAMLALAVSCATAPGARVSRQSAHERFDMAPSHRVIASGEIAASGAQTAEEVVRRFRPHLLMPQRSRTRIDGAAYLPTVYVNDLKAGSVEVLRGFPSSVLRDVRYYTETEANSRWVGVHPAGAIALRLW